MATKEDKKLLEVNDCAMSKKKERRGLVSMFAMTVTTLMLLMMVMLCYLVYLHVRLNKLEQCRCIIGTTRNSVMARASADDSYYGDVMYKVRLSL